ncbi:hypothetical protein [Neorhizobium sp. LjRoot104]|uniref:hypothetical protein n=1 Tax=Neorhizobium sp. LjRoot104 TaxID=3342254 RepID=UPI003F4FC1A7
MMVTTEPGLDTAPYQDRQFAILERDAQAAWLDPATSVNDCGRNALEVLGRNVNCTGSLCMRNN